jgi:hypothetical protein
MAEFGRFAMFSPKAASGAYTMTLDDNCILHTVGATNLAVTLPKASQVKGKVVYIQKVDAGAGYTVVTAASGDTIDGAASVNITAQYGKKMLLSNGSTWSTIV